MAAHSPSINFLPAEVAQEDFIRASGVLPVKFEALSLEVLNQPAIFLASLSHR